MAYFRGPRIITDNLLTYVDAGNTKSYPLTGVTMYDLVDGVNGTLTNGPVYSGTNMGSILLDGINDTIEMGNSTNTDFSNVLPWSFSFTFKTNVLPAADVDFLRKGSSTTTGFFMFYRSPTASASTVGQVFIRHNGTTRYAGTVDVTGVNMITVTYAGSGNMECYVNGVYLGNFGVMTGYSTGTALQLGLGNIYLNGYVYNFMKYTKQLSASEVLQNYNAIRTRFNQ